MTRQLSALVLAISIFQELGDACTDIGDSAKVWAGTKNAIVKVLATGRDAGCTRTGTGFVVSSAGHVLTAGHVVPADCNDLDLQVRFEGSQRLVEMRVAKRSSRDAVLLEPATKQPTSAYIQLGTSLASEQSFLEKRVVIVSFYKEDIRATFTAAKVDGVEMEGGGKGKWTICGPAANPGRSGSPVLLDDATAVAIFIERPGEQQDRARALPIRYLDDLELASLQKGGTTLGPVKIDPTELLYSFALDYSAQGFAGSGNGLYVFDDKSMEDVSKVSLFEQAQKSINKAVRTHKDLDSTLLARPGYRFDPASISFSIASHNPPVAPTPSIPCTAAVRNNCYEFSQDLSKITLHVRLFPGAFDGTGSWIDGAIVTRQVKR